jgi:TetR/AcrR family transcriptional regulator, tetracycline repressor protein
MAAKASSPNTESGRGRLRRESIVQTALELMNRIGLDALSLRRLADELHVQAPALYWHFANKQELLNAMAEAMLFASYSPSTMPPPPIEWTEWLLAMGRTLRKALLSYRDGARLLATADVSKGAVLSLDLALGVLAGAGFSYQAALIGTMTIVNYTLGFTFEEQASPRRDDGIAYLRGLISANQLPHLSAAFDENITPPDSESEFEASLRIIIAGLGMRH